MAENNNNIGLNELVDYQKKSYPTNMDKIMRFLWKCAGADQQILQYAPYSDHIKYAGIGGVVVATTVMATLAMGFAMHTIFASPVEGTIDPITGGPELSGNWFITIPIALIWGLIIFNLDRFIVSTAKGDGTEKLTIPEIKAMGPRIIMAILIGLTISAPLETYIFKREIYREWQNVSNKMAIGRQYEIQQKFLRELSDVKDNIMKNDTAFSAATALFNKYDQECRDIQAGVGQYAGRPCTNGKTCKTHGEIYLSRDKQELRMNELKSENQQLINQLKRIEAEQAKEVKNEQAKIEKRNPGFLDQIMMLEGLSSHGKEVEKYNAATGELVMINDEKSGKMIAEKEEIYGSAFWPIWLVRALFLIIEVAPVIFKFMIWKSSYEYLQENVSQILEAKQGVSLNNKLDENNKITTVRENYNAQRIAEVSKRQNDLEKENAIHAITLFAEKERENIEKNPENFVKPEAPESESSNDPNIDSQKPLG